MTSARLAADPRLSGDHFEIQVDGWLHRCHGDAIERNELVSWLCVVPAEGMLELDYHYSPEHDEDVDTATVTGRVVELEVLVDGVRVPVARVPSGAELNSRDPEQPVRIGAAWTDEVLEFAEEPLFVVTLAR
ncbi:hypothetical protein RDV89_14250 [Nocardioides zeae]|uniref:Uncharacterized protein n=1 Tax=Nocardioides imazamoxiresistens TaxID=3231893 RepID=A0ABU3PYJ1_9ACTN|nr:hypothetical protein [Nocardioides zeae]MDT9594241.1 hypothetical protein [Nocardioides zeae]